jgi:HSP20 family protein
MAAPEKWIPSRELDRFRSEVDSLLERFNLSHRSVREPGSATLRPAIEVFADNDLFAVRIDLPGIDATRLEIKVKGGFLIIRGTRREKQQPGSAHFYQREIRYGAFERSIQLPESVKAEDLKATYVDGVLEIVVTVPANSVSRKIRVEVDRSKKV